jgi:hypothetical protein
MFSPRQNEGISIISKPSRLVLVLPPVLCKISDGGCWEVKLTTDLPVVQRLRIGGTINPFLYTPSWLA